MSYRRWTRWLAWTGAVFGLVLYGVTAWLGFLRGSRVLLFGAPPQTWLDVASSAPFAAFPIVAAVIISRQPTNRFAWLFGITGVCNATANFAGEYAAAALLWHRNLPLGQFAAWLAVWVWVVSTSSVPLAVLLFPDGQFLTRRWRLVGVASVVNTTVLVFTQMFLPDPTGRSPFPNPLGLAAMVSVGKVLGVVESPIVTTLVLLAAVSFLLRYRRSDSEVRHQLKWLVLPLILVPFSFLLNGIANPGPTPASSPLSEVSAVFQFFSQATFLAAVSVAILKYRLYDIDLVLSRALVYGALAAFITAVYVGIVVGIGTLVGSGGKPNLALSIVATAIVAVAFQPVRERVQKLANRLVYGKRATPYEVLSQFSERVADSYADDDVLPRMARLLADGTGAARADVWLRTGAILRQAATSLIDSQPADPAQVVSDSLGGMPEVDRAVEVRHQGELLGALTVTKRKGESLTPVEEKLLDDLGAQAGLVLKNVGLKGELLARLADLRASRQRLVAAQDEERRRLERNLHDGAQQNLVALKVKLGLAEAFAEKDPARARELVGQLKADADKALETLRDLARGIYPPLLADKGLAAALEAQARKATVPVEVSADDIGRYPQDMEAAVYFCALEALKNTQKYANASRASVTLTALNGDLRFEVEDDGGGFDAATIRPGRGLQNMKDRIEALGGAVDVDSTPGGGTRLRGRLPVRVEVPIA